MKRGPWAAWMASVAVSFALLEYGAVGARMYPPLTSYLQRLLGIYPPGRRSRIALIVLGAGWTWLVVHLVHDVEAK